MWAGRNGRPRPRGSRYLKAMVPTVPFGNAYEIAYSGGALQLALLMGWGTAVGGVTLAPEKLPRKPFVICPSTPTVTSLRRRSLT